jgi:hypothetical protein
MLTETKPRAQELLAAMTGGALYREAYQRGMTLSAYLDDVDDHDYGDKLDGFSRLVKLAGIKVRSDPARGYYADRFEAFDGSLEARALVPEWIARQWRKVAFGSNRVLLTSDVEALNTSMRPYVDAAQARAAQIQPAIPLNEIVAMTTPIDGDAYRSFYLTEPTAANKRMVRVAQGAEVPRVSLVGGDHTIRLFKYGRALEVTYEVLRRQRIDKVAFWIARMAIQAEVDKLATALDVAINGDGNSGTAATSYNLSDLDGAATPPTLTLRGWLAFKLKFPNPYSITHALVQEAVGLQMMLLNLGSANVPLVSIQAQAGFGGLTPINPELRDNVRLGITAEAPTNKIVGFDGRLAIERVTEIGSDITEVERWATRQTQALVMSEVEGYGVLDQAATRVLDLAS